MFLVLCAMGNAHAHTDGQITQDFYVTSRLEHLNEIGLELEVAYDTISNLDSNKAIVYSQYPDPEKEENRVITLGSIIHVMANMTTPLDTTNTNLPNE